MNEFKKLDIHKLKRLKEKEKYEYQLSALEYYGNLKNQLLYFSEKEKYHNFLLNMVRLYPINIHKLNEFVYPNDKNVIFSANHSNANDFIVVSRLIIRHFFIMADFTMINDPVVNFFNQANGCIYLDRHSKRSGQNAIEQAIDGVSHGYNMMIFPEATWNLLENYRMLPRKWGDIIVAQQTARPIIPIGLVYNSNNCFVKFGKPFFVTKNDSVIEKDKQLYRIMELLREDIYSSQKYKDLYKEQSYEEWLMGTIRSYKNFDVDYELSVVRNGYNLYGEEFRYIKNVGEKIHPIEQIEERLSNSIINYRIKR